MEWTGLDGGSNVNSFCGKNVTLQENDVITGLSIYIHFACLFLCLFVSNKRFYGRTDQAQILYGNLRPHGKVDTEDQHYKKCAYKKSSIFSKILKVHKKNLVVLLRNKR